MTDKDLPRDAETNEEGSDSDEILENTIVEYSNGAKESLDVARCGGDSMNVLRDAAFELKQRTENTSPYEVLPAMTNVIMGSMKTVLGAAMEGRIELPEVNDDGSMEASMQKAYNAAMSSVFQMLTGTAFPVQNDAVQHPSGTTATVVECEEVD